MYTASISNPAQIVQGFLLQVAQSKAMLTGMKKISDKILITLIAVYSFSAFAGLYKGLDKDGSVSYSDTPFENAEKMTPPPITIIDAPKKAPEVIVETEEVESDEKPETTYSKFKISAPTNGQTIWNTPDLTVSVSMTPSLDTEQGHTIWLLMDGKALVKKSRTMLMQIGRADRGEHKLQTQVRNKQGKIIKRSKPITVHIKHSVVPR